MFLQKSSGDKVLSLKRWVRQLGSDEVLFLKKKLFSIRGTSIRRTKVRNLLAAFKQCKYPPLNTGKSCLKMLVTILFLPHFHDHFIKQFHPHFQNPHLQHE